MPRAQSATNVRRAVGDVGMFLDGIYFQRGYMADFQLGEVEQSDAKGAAPVTLDMGNIPLKLDYWLVAAPLGDATTLRIPIFCFADLDGDLAQTGNGASQTAQAGFAVTLIGAKVEAVGEIYPCPLAAPLPQAQ